MRKLERLTQSESSGKMSLSNGDFIGQRNTIPVGKIRTIVLENFVDIENKIQGMCENYPESVPLFANSYTISDFNGGTQKIVKDDKGNEHMLSAYAIQFYLFF